jgi:transcriptional regulator with XRE-family HTH domain
MEIVERILHLIKIKNVVPAKMLSDLELSPSAISEWKKGKAKPSADAIIKIAKYFNVTTDYLFGLTEDPVPAAPTGEDKLQSQIRKLTPQKRAQAEQFIEFLKTQEEFSEELTKTFNSLGQKPLTD